MTDPRNWQVYINDPAVIVEGIEDIAQCVYTILATVEGSDPLRSDFGSTIYQYVDRPLSDVQTKIIYAATEAIAKWEKRILVTKCRLAMSGNGHLNIIIEAKVIASAAQITIKTTV